MADPAPSALSLPPIGEKPSAETSMTRSEWRAFVRQLGEAKMYPETEFDTAYGRYSVRAIVDESREIGRTLFAETGDEFYKELSSGSDAEVLQLMNDTSKTKQGGMLEKMLLERIENARGRTGV